MLKLSVFIALSGFLLLLYTGNLLGYSRKVAARVTFLSEKGQQNSNEKSELQFYRINKVIARVDCAALVFGVIFFAISYAFFLAEK